MCLMNLRGTSFGNKILGPGVGTGAADRKHNFKSSYGKVGLVKLSSRKRLFKKKKKKI